MYHQQKKINGSSKGVHFPFSKLHFNSAVVHNNLGLCYYGQVNSLATESKWKQYWRNNKNFSTIQKTNQNSIITFFEKERNFWGSMLELASTFKYISIHV